MRCSTVVLSRPQFWQYGPLLGTGHSRAICPFFQQLKQAPCGGLTLLSVGTTVRFFRNITPDKIEGSGPQLETFPEEGFSTVTNSWFSIPRTQFEIWAQLKVIDFEYFRLDAVLFSLLRYYSLFGFPRYVTLWISYVYFSLLSIVLCFNLVGSMWQHSHRLQRAFIFFSQLYIEFIFFFGFVVRAPHY